jgi:hypothetical protein
MSRILLESRRISQISANQLIGDPSRSVTRFHAVHLVIGGDHELVQRVAVDAKRGRPDTDPDPRKTISPQRK